MADPTTELAKEFLEFNSYSVRKETKFYKNKDQKGTPSDIDIIATSPTKKTIGDLELAESVIAEAKNWEVKRVKQLDEIYENKFKFIDQPEISWNQLKKFIPSRYFDKVLFCLATTENVSSYALQKYGLKIITSGFIIKQMAQFFKGSTRKWSFYPEAYNYNIIKAIMYYFYTSHQWIDQLTLEDLVSINPESEPQYRNRFVEINAKFLEEFVYRQSDGGILVQLINRLAQECPKWFKKQLKSNEAFWTYLVH